MIRLLPMLLLAAALAPTSVESQSFTSSAGLLKAVPVTGPLVFPWSIAWLPDGTLLVSERPGRLNLIRAGKQLPVAGLPRVASGGQGGLFDVLVLPADKGRQELVLAYAWEEGGKSLRVARATLSESNTGWKLEGLTVLFDLLPRSGTSHHFGGRLARLPDGTLLIATGERGDGDRAQNPLDGAGKIHRINLDGSVPADNPFRGKQGWLPTVWSLGHRNIQGLWVDPVNGDVWATEHGPQGGDEVNLVRPGRNYGWPVITYGVNYGSGTKIGEGVAKAGMEQPVLYWKPSIAPAGLTRYDGDRYGGWKGSFLSGALAGEGLSRFRVGFDAAAPRTKPARAAVPSSGVPAFLTEEEYLPAGDLGRIRDVRTGPDGYLYFTTDDPKGRVYRLEP